MNLHEYQAKQILRDYHLPVPKGEVAWNVDEALTIASAMSLAKWVVKAQVHAGGRGKAGGVKIVSNKEDLAQTVKELIDRRLVTYQTTSAGQPVNQVLIEEPAEIARELYVGAVIDRSKRRVVFMVSTEGGVDIEKIAEESPEKIKQIVVDPLVGVQPFQCRDAGFALGLTDSQIKQFTKLMAGLYKMFIDNDLSLLEINPLVVTKSGDLVCLDAKINIDDNAMYRQTKLREMRDTSQEDERENRAQQAELNYIYIRLDDRH